ncbi:hypothetical protein JKF63_02483 [Porcisia hertigi]|uniref:Uncharacterized protein n=1 Tax=Porcisia hertigi TaxID=2761500 RepID=A0A836H9L1_9TRYP|nr:hypothetical protein JKF63_02483 [Porcisia hertigi]
MTEVVANTGGRAFKGRQRAQHEVQTEATFVPGCSTLEYAYDPLASEQFENLVTLRQMIQSCLRLVAGDVYDVVSFKDILFQLERELPSSLPVTDLLLLSSRLFRRTAELGRLLSCFFGVVFADDHNDEHFHFAEVRLLQRELRQVKQQLTSSEEERTQLKELLENVGQVAYDHGKAVELLETHNKVLKKQSTALKEQMAVLFHQLNTGLEGHCKGAYHQVTGEMKVQESLNPARITFRQTMDSLSEQLRGSRGLITDVRGVLMRCSQGRRTGEAYMAVEPSVRFKLGMLESNFQQLMGRFTAVKDTVVETAQELMGALQERKKILYLSFQHIRLYDLHNAKLRNARAILSQLQQHTSEVVRRIRVTFPNGNLTSVDHFGNITTQRWKGGYTLAALRGYHLTDQNRQNSAEAPEVASRNSIVRIGSSSSAIPGAQASMADSQMMTIASETTALEKDGARSTSVMLPTLSAGRSLPFGRSAFPPQGQRASMATARGSLRSVLARDSNNSTGVVGVSVDPVRADSDEADVPPFESISTFLDLMTHIDEAMDELQRALALDDEMGAFLKILTLSASTTPRADEQEIAAGLTNRASMTERREYNFEVALLPTGSRPGGHRAQVTSSNSFTESLAGPESNSRSSSLSRAESPSSPLEGRGGSRIENATSEAAMARQAVQLQRQQEQIAKMQEDFTSKIGFLRQVYEARIGDLEVREATVSKRLGQQSPAPNQRGTTDTGNGRPPTAGSRAEEGKRGPAGQSEKEKLMKLRREWYRSKRKMQPNRKLREATIDQLHPTEEEENT